MSDTPATETNLETRKGLGWRALLAHPEIGLALIIVLIFLFTAFYSRTATKLDHDAHGNLISVERNVFLTADNLHGIIVYSSYYAIMAIGATLVLIGGGVDLSIGSLFCLSAVIAAHFMSAETYTGRIPISSQQELQWIAAGELPPAATRIAIGVFAGLLCGVVCGAFNGLLITWLKSPPFLITLGTMLIFRGLAFLITKGHTISALPATYVQEFGQVKFMGGFTVHTPIMLATVMLGVIFISYTLPGRMSLAVGGNEDAARVAGIPIHRIKIMLYAMAGLLAALSSMLFISSTGSIQSGDGFGWELTVIAAAVIGGASLTGGRGTAIGALLGAIFLQEIHNSLIMLSVDQNYEMPIIGFIIIAAAATDRLRERVLGS